eukprot:gene9099-12270_t
MEFSFNSTSVEAKFKFDPTKYYELLSNDFGACHQNPINVLLHLFTTPLGLVGAISLLRLYTKSSSAALTIVAFYLLSLLPIVPNGVFAGTAILSGFIIYLSRQLKLNWMVSLGFIGVGYMLQDLAHLGTGEKTYQSTYSAGGSIDLNHPIAWFQLFVEHCYYLLPLCVHVSLPFLIVPQEIKNILDAPLPVQLQQLNAFTWMLAPLIIFAMGSYCLDSKNSFCFFPGTAYFHRVIQCSLTNNEKSSNIANSQASNHSRKTNIEIGESRKEDLKTVRDWAMSHNPPESQSSHWWYRDLTGNVRAAFERCAGAKQINDMFRSLFSQRHYCLDIVDGMNEIYISGPSRVDEVANSDHVFYSRHVDGPFGLVPFVSVYRCIVGMDCNNMITTHFPLAQIDKNACEGDVLAFDFNREVHYISCDESKKNISDKYRVTLKLHYCVYPRVLAPLGWLMHFLNVRYNISFRALFLKTINPVSMYEHFLAWNVNWNTSLMDQVESMIGQRNILYVCFALGLWRATGSYEVFFALTSFVHYIRYISTFYYRKGIDFGSFKRDVFLFKCMALAQIFYHYFFPQTTPFVLDWISILMTLCGYYVSSMATVAIGIDRTYFAAELGLVEPKWITKFPYGYIPHPMIVSQIFALLGLYKASHFRKEWPYIVPIHITLYLIHMLQEHFDVYKKYPASNTVAIAASSKSTFPDEDEAQTSSKNKRNSIKNKAL